MNNFGLTKVPFRRPRRYEFIHGRNVTIRLKDKKLRLLEVQQWHFISVQVMSGIFFAGSDPRLYINIVGMPNGNPSHKTTLELPKP